MTKQYIFLIFLIACNFLFYGQRFKIDTIDYNVFFNSKSLACHKITEGKFDRVITVQGRRLFSTYKVTDPKLLVSISSFLNPNDTVMDFERDLEKGLPGHSTGKITLNKQTNLITLEKRNWSNPSEKIVSKFKIIKLTKTEVVILDFSNLEKNRKYYFK